MKKKYLAAIAGGAMVATLTGLAAFGMMMASHPSRAVAAATCTPTGFYRDGINLTAALINPSGVVSGEVDAAGCDIGVYYGSGATGTVNHADVHNAVYFGVVNDGGVVTVENSSIHEIGDAPLDNGQYGVAVYWAYGSNATGKITNNTISNYQTVGIKVSGTGSWADIRGNTVTGLGPIDFNAQYGIQIGYGATANVMGNTVRNNSYTGTDNVSGGIVIVGGPYYQDVYTTNVQIVGNTVRNNDIGVWLSNIDTNFNSPTTPTNIQVVNNIISSDGVYNHLYGGYQAGIADQGDNDKLIHNNISGLGYTPDPNASAYLIQIDADSSFTNNAKIHANVIH